MRKFNYILITGVLLGYFGSVVASGTFNPEQFHQGVKNLFITWYFLLWLMWAAEDIYKTYR